MNKELQHGGGRRRVCRARLQGALAIGSLLAPLPLMAQDYPSEMDILADIPLVTSATRLQQLPEDSPATVMVIDREMIKASGAINIADLFRLVPGFEVAHVNGHDFSVTSHGLADQYPRRLLIQVDGRSLHTAFNSTVYWSSVPLELEDIERIEIITGPNVASYGANAFNGVINITTRQPYQTQGDLVSVTAGSQSLARGMYRHGGRAGGLEYRVSASHRQDQGFDRVNDDSAVDKLSMRGNYQLNVRDQLDMELGVSEGTFGVGLVNDVFEPQRNRHELAHDEYLRWTRSLGPAESVYVQFYHNGFRMDDDFTIGPLLDVVNNAAGLNLDANQFMAIFGIDGNQSITYGLDDVNTHRYDLELQHSLQLNDSARLVWGGGLRYDYIRGPYKFAGDHDEEDLTSRLFASVEHHLTSRLVLNAGADIEHNSITGANISPRIGLNFHILPDHTLRAGAARAYRTPSLLEAYEYNVFTFAGGPPLVRRRSAGLDKAESITSFELGYIGYWLQRALSLDVKVYHEKIAPVIETVLDKRNPNDDPYNIAAFVEIINNDVGTAKIDGFEARLLYRPMPASFVALQYAYTSPRGAFSKAYKAGPGEANKGFCAGPPDAAGFYHICNSFGDYAPYHSVSLLGSYLINQHWQASLAAYASSGFTWFGNGDRLPSYNRVDARLARKFRVSGSAGELAVIVQNIGTDYLEFRDDNSFDTRSYLQLELSL